MSHSTYTFVIMISIIIAYKYIIGIKKNNQDIIVK